jgi:hypothetical protein
MSESEEFGTARRIQRLRLSAIIVLPVLCVASCFAASCSKSKTQPGGVDGDRARVEEKPFNRDQYVLEAMIAERERLARNRDNPQSKVKMLNLDQRISQLQNPSSGNQEKLNVPKR